MSTLWRCFTRVMLLTALCSNIGKSKQTFGYDDAPSLLDLQHFPVKDEFKNILEEIANDYVNFGIHLLDDHNGNRVKSIESQKRGDPTDITVEIVRKWLQGKGSCPVTWQIFLECLRKSKLNFAADYIQAALVPGSTSSFPWEQQQQPTCSRKASVGQKIQRLQNHARCNHSLIGRRKYRFPLTTGTTLQSRDDFISNAVWTIVFGILLTVCVCGALTAMKIQKIVREDKRPVLSDIPKKPCHTFLPRTDEVRMLKDKFKTLKENNPGSVANTVYITGDPASGKTQLAGQFGKEYYEVNKRKNKKIFVGTLTVDNFLQSYLQIAHDLACVKDKAEVAIRSGQLDELESLKMLSQRVKKELRERPGWLLIIDGLTLDEELFQKLNRFWPQHREDNWGSGYVLVTTQGCAPIGYTEMDLRGGMSVRDAVELLIRESDCSDKEGATELVESLDRSPLSVASAGLFIKTERSRKPSYSFKDYQEGIIQEGTQERSEQELLKGGQGPYKHTRKEAISMVAKQIVSNDPKLHKVFVLFASCAQAPVPFSLVARVLGVQPDSRELKDVCKCALLSPVSAGLGDIETVSVHQVTRSVFNDLFLRNSSTSAGSQLRNDLINITNCVYQEYAVVSSTLDTNPVSSFQTMKLLIPHMESLLQILPDFNFDAIHEVKIRLAMGQSYCLHLGRHKEAKEVLENALRICSEEGLKETERGAEVARELGWCYVHLELYERSEHILIEVRDTFMNLCGEYSVDVARVFNYLGWTYCRMRQFHHSRKCFERALEIYKKLHGCEHNSVAIVLMNLGGACEDAGDNAKAISLCEEALDIQEKIYGPNHFKVALSLHNLGRLVWGKRGIDLLERSLEIRRNVFGEDCPDVANTLCCLSQSYHELGSIDEARIRAIKAYSVLKDTNDVLLMAFIQYRLGSIHLVNEEFEKAQQHFQHCLATRKDAHGMMDKSTQQTQQVLVVAIRLAGKLQHAKEILETAQEEVQKTSAIVDNVDASDILAELGKVYLELGYLTKSLQAQNQAMDNAKGFKSEQQSYQVAFRKADLAQVLWESGEVRSGLDMMQQALKMYQQSTESDTTTEDFPVDLPHPRLLKNTNYISMLVLLSQMLQGNGNLKEARGYLEDALWNLRQSSLPHNLVKAKTLCSLGTVFHKLAAQTTTNPIACFHKWYYIYKARQLRNSALHIVKKVHDHHNTATVLAAIGRLDLDSGDFRNAKAHLKEALHIRIKYCGSIHPNIALYHQLLAKVAIQTGDERSAKSHSHKANKIYTALIKREKEMSEKAGIKLPILQKWQKISGNNV